MRRIQEGRKRQSPTQDAIEQFIHAADEQPERPTEGDEHRIRRTWTALNSAAVGERLARPRRREPEDGSPLYKAWLAETVADERQGSGSQRPLRIGALTAAVAGVALFGVYQMYGSRFQPTHLSPNIVQSYSTAGTQTRSVDLPDGSHMALGAVRSSPCTTPTNAGRSSWTEGKRCSPLHVTPVDRLWSWRAPVSSRRWGRSLM